MRHPSLLARRRYGPARWWLALLGSFLMVLGLSSTAAYGRDTDRAAAADQVLTWTAGDPIDHYLTAPETAVAGPATLVFENSAATGNTTSMPHTLTFSVSDPEHNSDVQVNILANPGDSEGGKHSVEVTLTPGTYLYHCTIPGHTSMKGVLTVTEDGGGGDDDTTAPETSATVDGDQNADGAYIGQATVTVAATDADSGVDTVEYAIGADGEWQPYTAPVVVDEVGEHSVRYRATDKAGNAAEEKSADFEVAAPPTDDETPPETSATVSGEQDDAGAYLGMATVTVTASDTGSGVNTIEYAIGADGDWQTYTAPVMVHEVGEHSVRYRATDRSGNVADEKSVDFTVVEPPSQDQTPPETSVALAGDKNSDGAFITSAEATLTATDDDSGVDKAEYSLDGGPYLEYSSPVIVDRVGYHTFAHRATDKAGNTSEAKQSSFTVAAGGGVPAPNCPEFDERHTVIVGTVDTGVPNRITGNRCTINELIEDEKDWSSHALFLKHVDTLLDKLLADGVIDKREHKTVYKAAKESGIGKPGQDEGYRKLFDGTAASLAKWEQVGGGAFALNEEEGSITSSTTVDGMGMLWFPSRQYGDFSLKLQWRDDAPGDGNANGGVFVRFPNVHDHPEESRPEWVAINYGHEIQAYDGPAGDMYKTGSVYGFDRVGLGGAGVTPKGTWNDYEIRWWTSTTRSTATVP